MQAQLALSIAALLPWLTRHFRHSVHSSTAGIVVLVSVPSFLGCSQQRASYVLKRLLVQQETTSLTSMIAAAADLSRCGCMQGHIAELRLVADSMLMRVQAHARACRAAGYAELGAALITMSSDNQEATPAILARVCHQLCLAFFPRQAAAYECLKAFA